MKKKFAFLFLFVLSLTLFNCTDPCEDVDCNQGSCIEGTCDCDDGFEGEFCDIRRSEIFAGQWEGPFDCVELTENAILNIEDDEEDIRKIQMNSEGIDMSLNGFIFTLDNTILHGRINEIYTGFFIDTQTMIIEVPNNPGISADVYGTGTLVDDNTINIEIKVKNDDFGASFSCSGVIDKK